MARNGNGSSVQERAAAGVDPQDGLFDHQWSDGDLEAALEERERLRRQKLDAAREFATADDAAKEQLARFELAVGEVARIGRFRVKKTQPESRDIEFTTNPQARLSISIVA